MIKHLTFIITLLFTVSTGVTAQSFEKKSQAQPKDTTSLYPLNMDFAIGYAPKNPYHALKADFSVNNFFLKRFGAYTSFEKGADSEYYSFILGLTTYLNKHFYLWYGLGVFTHYQTKNSNDWKSFRKELGIGFNPHKNMVARVGWSYTVGPTFTIGYRLPLNKQEPKETSKN